MDISKKTIAILLILVIALSIAGTWLALNSTKKVQDKISTDKGIVRAQVVGKVAPPSPLVQDLDDNQRTLVNANVVAQI